MSLWLKLRGITETIFQIGLSGPQLKNNAGVVEARNAADAAFAVVRGATAVSGNDLVTFAQLPGGSATSRGYYGDGNDGAANFDGAATPAGSTKNSGTSYTLNRDVYYTTISVSAGVTVSANGWRPFGTGTCTLTGNLDNSGTAGTTGTSAAGGAPGVRNYLGGVGGNPGTGGAASAIGNPGVNGQGVISNPFGGAGGAGGASVGGHGGGNGGLSTAAGVGMRPAQVPEAIIAATVIVQTNATISYDRIQGGAGGGGGGNDAGTPGSGGGGGGVLLLAVPKLTGSGNLIANGGNGGNATSTDGAGGGGGGGVVILVCGDISGWTGTAQVNGGAHGTVGTGGTGVNGSNGTFFNIPG